jgi:hypothetical protein
MTSSGVIHLDDAEGRVPLKILQLYPNVELLAEGEPQANSLFVLGPAAGPRAFGDDSGDQMLIVDPPEDVTARFRLPANVAALQTCAASPLRLPVVQTVPGGTSHIRVGEHFLDVHATQSGALVHLPALGILCSGCFGSPASLPILAESSAGDEELATLRLLAQLVKQSKLQMLIPRTGAPATSRQQAMEALAGDVAYLHSLRRILAPLLAAGATLAAAADAARDLVPPDRRTAAAAHAHRMNITRLHRTLSSRPT